ncbi:hypothetical protein Rmet_6741 (plasmid) [Cupriavidus metallidurans CH34]|uniref:Uncharacterized protein n=1 Tax=Cupriavidus metallidurans (strain ATCC 43123 / DSM 2839 / NBRC 102507 / CH34) TaxID=266264 RepID=D3DYF0_CUPMC|nr:hypothetical protein Rmet_6741 [Cupriavidus metallidurans CH34]
MHQQSTQWPLGLSRRSVALPLCESLPLRTAESKRWHDGIQSCVDMTPNFQIPETSWLERAIRQLWDHSQGCV